MTDTPFSAHAYDMGGGESSFVKSGINNLIAIYYCYCSKQTPTPAHKTSDMCNIQPDELRILGICRRHHVITTQTLPHYSILSHAALRPPTMVHPLLGILLDYFHLSFHFRPLLRRRGRTTVVPKSLRPPSKEPHRSTLVLQYSMVHLYC